MTQIKISAYFRETTERLISSQSTPQFPISVPGTPFLIYGEYIIQSQAQAEELFFVGKTSFNQKDFYIYQSIKKTA